MHPMPFLRVTDQVNCAQQRNLERPRWISTSCHSPPHCFSTMATLNPRMCDLNVGR